MLVEFFAFNRNYLERLRHGDVPTGEHFADYFGRLLRLKLGSRLSSRSLMDDVRQETFLRVWAALRKDDGVRHPERFGAFVNSVCNNVLREQHRRSLKDDHTEDGYDTDVPDHAMGGEDVFEVQESWQRVGRALAKLPAKPRTLIQKVFLEECGKDDLCRELAVNRRYFRVLVHRATLQLRKEYLKEIGPGADPTRRNRIRPSRVSGPQLCRRSHSEITSSYAGSRQRVGKSSHVSRNCDTTITRTPFEEHSRPGTGPRLVA